MYYIKKLTSNSNLLKLPDHTQEIESTVKFVTEASKIICGLDGYIRTQIDSRPNIETLDAKIQCTKCKFYKLVLLYYIKNILCLLKLASEV